MLCCGLEKNGIVGAWHGKCESDKAALCKSHGKDSLNPLAARYGRGTAWARHAMFESTFRAPSAKWVTASINVTRINALWANLRLYYTQKFSSHARENTVGACVLKRQLRQRRFEKQPVLLLRIINTNTLCDKMRFFDVAVGGKHRSHWDVTGKIHATTFRCNPQCGMLPEFSSGFDHTKAN